MKRLLFTLLTVALCLTGHAQESSADSTIQTKKASRFSVGGYGEANFTRNYFSDHVSRYSQPEEHKNDPSNGRFDIPHAVIYLGYDFGQGWKFGTEIEFEHGGTGIAYEKEDEEGGEWEQETEKGGEVELEQFWIEKSFASWANIRAGHIVVPVGLNNAHHEPLSYFTVYRPEGENTILPSTWHQTGVSFWGRAGDFRYEAQFLAGLNADQFTNTGWIHKGHKSPMEFDVANKYGVALRFDNYSVPGLRIGLSGYYGHSIGNSYPRNANGVDAEYKGVNKADSLVEGTFTQHGMSFPLKLTPGEKKAKRPQTPKAPFPYATEEVSFTNGSAILKGTLTLPQGCTRKTPVLIMVTGSGLQNRDEEIFEHKPFAVIADALAREGIATLRYDDRTCGKSVGGGTQHLHRLVEIDDGSTRL